MSPAVIESEEMQFHLDAGIMVHIFQESLLEGIRPLTLGCNGNSFQETERELERQVASGQS